MTPDATRRRVIGQILLLAAGLIVLTIISAGSVYLVNKAREDAGSVVHTVEVENQLSLTQLQLRRALDEMVVEGIETTLPLFRALVREPDIIDGDYHIHWLEEYLAGHPAG